MESIRIETPMKCGFFNCAEGTMDRVYSAEDFTGYLSSMICNGILDTWGNRFQPSFQKSTLMIDTGYAWINGHYAVLSQAQKLDLAMYADKALNRWVAIGISCDTDLRVRDCSIEILPGISGVYSNNEAGWKVFAEKNGFDGSVYPDVNGDGIVDSVDASLIQYFSAAVGIGQYSNNKAGWEIFAEEKGLDGSVYPDINGDGFVDAIEASLILSFSAYVGTGTLEIKPDFIDTETKTHLTIAYAKIEPDGTISTLEDVRDNENKCGYVKCILSKCKVTDLCERVSEMESQLHELMTNRGGIQNIGTITTHHTAVTGGTGILENQESEEG